MISKPLMKCTKNRYSGFTLIELMVSVAIVGLLSSVAIPTFSKYIAKAKTTEAFSGLRYIYDSQQVFGSDLSGYYQNSGGRIECKRETRFSPLCTRQVGVEEDEESGLFHGLWMPPHNKKSHYEYLGAPEQFTYSCSEHGSFAYYGAYQLLNIADTDASTAGTSISSPIGPAYFMYGAKTDSSIAAAYSVNEEDTIMIYAVADLNGNAVSINTENATCGQTANPFRDELTVIGRSIYFKDGEMYSTGMFKVNLGE